MGAWVLIIGTWYYIANPDLVARIRQDAPLNPGRTELFYSRGDEGYTDYPTLADAR